MTRENQLRAMTYVMYMFAEEAFPKARCSTSVLEEKCRLQYHEMKADKQVSLEQKCERYLSTEVFGKLPKSYFCQPVDLMFRLFDESHGEIRVQHDRFVLRLQVEMLEGGKVKLAAQRLVRAENQNVYGSSRSAA